MWSIRRISLRELHQRTGSLIREASAAGYAVVVTDRGRPIATITPYAADTERQRFRKRLLSPAFEALQRKQLAGDSTSDPESGSAPVRNAAASIEQLVTSELARAEFASTMHRKRRERVLTKREIDAVLEQFNADCRARVWSSFR